jgi:hypothetical protein
MLRAIGILLLVGSLGLVVHDIYTWPQPTRFQVAHAPAFDGAAQRYVAEKTAALGEVTTILADAEDWGLVLARITSVSLWVSFIASSLVTTLVGKETSATGSSDTEHRSGGSSSGHMRLRLVGVLGITAALGTAAAGFTEKQAKAALECVDGFPKIQAEIMDDVDKAPTSAQARQYLQRMIGRAKRCNVWIG